MWYNAQKVLWICSMTGENIAEKLNGCNNNILLLVRDELNKYVLDLYPDAASIDIVVEVPKDISMGDFSTNVAFLLKSIIKDQNVREIAVTIADALSKSFLFSKAEVAGAAFINLTVHQSIWHQLLYSIDLDIAHFGRSSAGSGKSIVLEYVSANPTGPIHVGHTRGTIFGDAMANLLSNCGYDVTREYLINDAGSQIKTLIDSVLIRYKQLFGSMEQIQDGMYPGDYVIDVAQMLKDKYGDEFLDEEYAKNNSETLRLESVRAMMHEIRQDLQKLGVVHNSFISEKSDVQDTGLVEKAFDMLREKGAIELGVLEAPKGHDMKDWSNEPQWLLKTTKFGDDMDRVIKKRDGSYTYLAGDLGLAYHRLVQRAKYDEVMIVLGADHVGYVKRMKALYYLMSEGKVDVDIPCVQVVNLFKEGKPLKMSKRAGTFVTVTDVMEDVGMDVLRFYMLTRKNDTVIDFDLAKAKEQSKDNPVFYVQYAHARACSAIRSAENQLSIRPDIAKVEMITNEAEIAIIKKISHYPKILEQAATQHEPHRVIYYLIELANDFHSLWARGNEDVSARFILPENAELTSAKLALVDVFRKVMALGLGILGIKAMDVM